MKLFILSTLLLLTNLSNHVYAACTYTAKQNGDWYDPNTWMKSGCNETASSIPTHNAVVIVPISKTVTINSNSNIPLTNTYIYINGNLVFNNGQKLYLACNSYLEVAIGGKLSGDNHGSKISFCDGWAWEGTEELGFYSIGSNPLPITLNRFELNTVSKGIEIFWSTATEQNNAYFEIMHSNDGQYWDVVEKVKGAGNSQNELRYISLYPTNESGIHYFKLKQTDYDGKSTESPVKSILFKNSTQALVYPNPANQLTNIRFDFAAYRTVQILNTNGIEIERKVNEDETFTLQTSHLEDGIYFIYVDGLFSTKLIVQH